MGKQIKGLLYFFITDIRHSVTIFYTILMSILVVILTIAYLLIGVEDGRMTFSLTAPMYIYCAILGFLTVKEFVPFSIKMGATRRNMFISLAISFLGLSVVMAVVGSTLQQFVVFINTKLGIDTFSFIHIAYFTNDTWLSRIIIDISIMFFFLSVMFVIGLLFYKYGLAGGGSALGVIVVILLLGLGQGWLPDLLVETFRNIDNLFYIKLLGVGVVIYAISMILLKRISVVKVK